jgi:hypothetical protein
MTPAASRAGLVRSTIRNLIGQAATVGPAPSPSGFSGYSPPAVEIAWITAFTGKGKALIKVLAR